MTFAIESIVRSSLVLSFGLVFLALMRHHPAAFRHSILAVAIALAALQPAANVVMPSWTLPRISMSTPVPAPATESAVEVTE